MEQDERYYYASDLIAEQYIRDYIMLRYTVTEDYAELKDRWRKNSIFYWYSTEEVYNEFQKKDAETVYE